MYGSEVLCVVKHFNPVAKPKVAVYIRWSTDEQSDGTTLEVQREACQLFIQSQGWAFRTDLVFVDDGYSGGGLDRPGLNRLRAAVRGGQGASGHHEPDRVDALLHAGKLRRVGAEHHS
jgi:hypothetical protein